MSETTAVEAVFYIGSLDKNLLAKLRDLFTDELYDIVQDAAPDAAVVLEFNELKEKQDEQAE